MHNTKITFFLLGNMHWNQVLCKILEYNHFQGMLSFDTVTFDDLQVSVLFLCRVHVR